MYSCIYQIIYVHTLYSSMYHVSFIYIGRIGEGKKSFEHLQQGLETYVVCAKA